MLLEEREGRICIRLYRRADGTVITADCPVGVKRRRLRGLVISAVSVGALAAAAFSFYRTMSMSCGSTRAQREQGEPDEVTMGAAPPMQVTATASAASPPPPTMGAPVPMPPHVDPKKKR